MIDFLIKFGSKRVDKRNLIRNLLTGWSRDENPKLVLAIIDMVINECREAQAIIKKRISVKNKS